MRLPLVMLATLGLAACGSPQVPDSGPGFQDYPSYLRQREAALSDGSSVVPPLAAPTQGFSTAGAGAAIDAAEGRPLAAAPVQGDSVAPYGAFGSSDTGTGGPLAANRARGDAPSNIAVQSGELLHPPTGISDEQDFSAVSSRETIQSDAERLARNRSQYQVIAPTALPERVGNAGPSIVEFALSTHHAPGTPMYKRSGLHLSNPASTCARYGSPDLAQEAFLAAGGPERDRKGIDPDGDGYACSWDPTPFRSALN